jgi:hypothetical protein
MPKQEMVNIEKEFEQKALALQNQIQTTGNYISTKNKTFTTPDGVTGDELGVIILAFGFRNEYYDGPYVQNNPVPPVCFAVGDVTDNMEPSANGLELQSDTNCKQCAMFQWGSSPTGAGKACKQQIIAAVMAPTDPNGEIMLLKVSPKGLRDFNSYMAQMANQCGHPISVVTKVTMDDSVSYPLVQVELLEQLANWKAFWPRINEAEKLVLQVPQYNYEEQEAAPAPRAAAKPRRAKKKKTTKRAA